MKPIKITEALKDQIRQKMEQYLTQIQNKEWPETFTFKLNDTIDSPSDKPVINITTDAYCKMQQLTIMCSTEIAWHGTVHREDNTFTITDIFGYPQMVTGGSVTTDDKAYAKWNLSQSSEQVASTRLQGHSHVNMGVSPSGTDLAYYAEMVQLIPDNSFYIFCINNKRGEYTWILYDFLNNIKYDTEDIIVQIILEDGTDRIAFYENFEKTWLPKHEPKPIHTISSLKDHSNYFKIKDQHSWFDDEDFNLNIPPNTTLTKEDYTQAKKEGYCPHCLDDIPRTVFKNNKRCPSCLNNLHWERSIK